jgi:hypothetical protein
MIHEITHQFTRGGRYFPSPCNWPASRRAHTHTASLELIHDRIAPTTFVNGKNFRDYDGAVTDVAKLNIQSTGNTVEEKSKAYLMTIWSDFKHGQAFDLILDHKRTLPLQSGAVVTFRQVYQGLPVENYRLKVKFDKNNNIRSISNNTFPVLTHPDLMPAISQASAIDIACTHFGINAQDQTSNLELIVAIDDYEAKLAWRILMENNKDGVSWEVIIDARTADLLRVKSKIHSINGTGRVFNPSPTYTAGVIYNDNQYPNYVNNNDQNHQVLEDELIDVVLPDITVTGGAYKLIGPYAQIVDGIGTFDRPTADFSCTRENALFEPVMVYYYLDKSMRYVNFDLGIPAMPDMYTGGLKFDPITTIKAGYDEMDQTIKFGKESGDVEPMEDGFVILHELGHALNDFLSGQLTTTQGLSEGIGDYWGTSETRRCDVAGTYREWDYDDRYNDVFHWGYLPGVDQRTTDFTVNYINNVYYGDHIDGQFISTALVRILNDIGKEKTDRLLLASMGMFLTSDDLRKAGKKIFDEAMLLGYSVEDQCIIYQHLDDILDIHLQGAVAPTGGQGDLFIKDTWCDNAEEINPNNGPLWISEDIYCTPLYFPEIGAHFDPEYHPTEYNWVNVRVRNNGCEPITDATLHVYFSKASTGLRWPSHWINYQIPGPNGQVIAGDKVNSNAISLPSIQPGEDWVESIEWINMPNPDDFYTEIHHFCLFARIESNTDPMHTAEIGAVYPNAKNNNNIAWKNLSIFNDEDDLDDDGVFGPLSVFVGSHIDYIGGSLKITTPENSHQLAIHELGNVYIELNGSFFSNWQTNGSEGVGFTQVSPGKFKVTSANFSIDDLPLAAVGDYVNVLFEPFNEDRFAAFDLIQTDDKGEYIGGERFNYRAKEIPSPGSSRKAKNSIEELSIQVFPNPVQDVIYIQLNDVNKKIHTTKIFNLRGKLLKNETWNGVSICQVSVSSMPNGIYMLEVIDTSGKTCKRMKIVKP